MKKSNDKLIEVWKINFEDYSIIPILRSDEADRYGYDTAITLNQSKEERDAKEKKVWGKHYLPHDATHKRQQGDSVKSPEDMLYELGLRDIEIVPRVDEIQHGIQATRDTFSQCWFDETHCKEGLAHLQQYRKEWNDRQGCWKDKPRHDIHSEAADAFRQFAQGYKFRQQIKQNQSRPLSWKVV